MKKRVLFIDRDGTIILETKNEKIDSFDKLVFYPKCIYYLRKICKNLNYELVMITNQDGLGTDYFPEETFWPVQNFIVQTFKNEGVVFENVFIDKTFPKENAPTRKPGTALLKDYIDNPKYDLANSFMIGDRLTDVELAKNIGAKAIYINDETHLGVNEISVKREELNPFIGLESNDWKKIYKYLKKLE